MKCKKKYCYLGEFFFFAKVGTVISTEAYLKPLPPSAPIHKYVPHVTTK